MDKKTVSEMAAECGAAHSEFIDKLNEIAEKYNVPRKEIYKMAVNVIYGVDINDNY